MADDWHVWDRICDSDAGAFDSFYRQNAPRLQVFLRHLVGDRQAAEDLMQETFTQIWLRPNGFQPERGSLRAYLFGIGRKRAAEWWRSRIVARETTEEERTAPTPEIVPAINEALRQLPEQQQTLLWLREVEGQSYAELAQDIRNTLRDREIAPVCGSGSNAKNLAEHPNAAQGESMNCQEAAEFVSCLCDGETIPRAAAEHIGECETCRARLAEYAEIGMELRRTASLELQVEPATRVWKKERSLPTSWWQKGWGVMRIPRFVFALLIVAIVALGSGLVVVKVRARTQGTVLMLTAKPSDGAPVRCALSFEDEKHASCPMIAGTHAYEFRIISGTADRVELGVRVGSAADVAYPGGVPSTANLGNLVEKPYPFEPGQKLEIPIPSGGTVVVTGEMMDHMPSSLATDPTEQIDPKAGELRLMSPLLFRGKEVVLDFGQEGVTVGDANYGINFYVPGDGIYYVSLSPVEGAIKGHVETSRLTFNLNGQSYTILAGAPIARGNDIWILYLSNRKPNNYQGRLSWGASTLADVLASSSESN